MNFDNIFQRAISREPITLNEAFQIYENVPLGELSMVANEVRNVAKNNSDVVTWQIDRNVNITNVCMSGCKFCNFHCKPHQHDLAYITSTQDYLKKIDETIKLGGDQLLLQGGMHPKLDLQYYEALFRELKSAYPNIKLHALGPPEIFHIARISGCDTETVLRRLIDAGLESLPGAGAEILDSAVRHKISPLKCSAEEWLDTMSVAHKLGLATSATMMYGHIESRLNRIEHLIKIRELQAEKPNGSYGFIAFIPWVFCSKGTELEKMGVVTDNSPLEYLRIIAISRIVLNNIDNIQASWLTMGREVGQMSLHAGANDLGSIMIEENVVSSAGATTRMDADMMRKTITDAGFTPRLRNQLYQYRD